MDDRYTPLDISAGQALLGYLNFSDGRADPRWQKLLNDAFAALLCLSLGCEGKRSRELDGEKPEVFETNIEILVAEIQKCEMVSLYEGLPNDYYEPELLAKELKDKDSVLLHEFPFYDEPITPEEKVSKELIALCGNPKTFRRYKGPKKCGGFHPDWCVEWKNGEATYLVLLCFGCCEARLYGPKNDVFSDLETEALKRLRELLTPLQKNRPKPKVKD